MLFRSILKFADDTKLAQVVSSREDADKLQDTLDNLCRWADRWGMQFNVKKCFVMHIGTNNSRFEYFMKGVKLSSTDKERDIGVIMSNSLKPADQCKKAAQTANMVLGQILRAFHFRDRHVFKRLYVQYVRPHLEFAVQAWAPWSVADADSLEQVQKRAVKSISGLVGQSYEDRLKELNLPTLQARRDDLDMVQTYKIVNGTGTDNLELWFERASMRRQTRQTVGLDNLVQIGRAHV